MKQIQACVVLQTPAYGTLTWGPFKSRDEADQWVADRKYAHELIAAYETTTPSGLVIMVCSLYDPDVSDFE